MDFRIHAGFALALLVFVAPRGASGTELRSGEAPAVAAKHDEGAAEKPLARPAVKSETKHGAKVDARADAKTDPASLVNAALHKVAAHETPARPPARVAAVSRAGHSALPTRQESAVLPVPAVPVTATAPAPAVSHEAHWSYEGPTGPHAWARLSPEWAKCGSGARQSPIDIRDGLKVDLEPVVFDYSPSRFRVIDNGHTIQANIAGWNSMRVMGRRFKLVQFHFHSPSEEMIDGKLFEMVAHLVHKDGEGRLAVVAVLIERGARQPAIQTVLNNLPLEKGEEVMASSAIDLNQLLPQDRRYYTYMGSLTTPPCSEDVLWIVMKQPVPAGPDQLNLFARLYPMNARPVQDAGERVIKESN